MSLQPELLKQIVGKTIAGIVAREDVGAGPRYQLFMPFTDNTHLEFYGDMGWSTHLETGDVETVKQYLARLGGKVVVINRCPLKYYQHFTKRERIPENRGAGVRQLPYFRVSSSHFVIY